MLNLIGAYSSYIGSHLKYLKEDMRKDRRQSSPFVTISRETGAFGTTVGEELRKYLQSKDQRKQIPWTLFSKDLLIKVAQEHNLSETILPYLSEKTISEIQDLLEETMGLHPSQHTLSHKTGETILHLCQLGYVIIIGRGANIISAQLPGGVHVRLISSLENRTKHVSKYMKLSLKKAQEHVLAEDRDRSNYVRKYFEKDIKDPLLYDLVINVDKVPPIEAARVIGNLVLEK